MKTIIFGNASMAKVVYSYMRKKYDIAGFTIDGSHMKESTAFYCGLPVFPFEDIEKNFNPEQYNMILPIGFIDMNELRAKRSLQAKEKGYQLISYVDDAVQIHYDVEIGENCVILDYVSIHPGSRIGANTFISSNVNIGHDCIIGANNWINAGVATGGSSRIGEGCFFGVNSSIGNNIEIGKRNFIAANTFVSKNTGDDEVYLSCSSEKFRLSSRNFLKYSKILG